MQINAPASTSARHTANAHSSGAAQPNDMHHHTTHPILRHSDPKNHDRNQKKQHIHVHTQKPVQTIHNKRPPTPTQTHTHPILALRLLAARSSRPRRFDFFFLLLDFLPTPPEDFFLSALRSALRSAFRSALRFRCVHIIEETTHEHKRGRQRAIHLCIMWVVRKHACVPDRITLTCPTSR